MCLEIFFLVVDVYRGLLLSGGFKGFQCSKLFGDVSFSIFSSVVRFKWVESAKYFQLSFRIFLVVVLHNVDET